jgi:hypothetical protein
LNLAVNARDAMPISGTITISAQAETIAGSNDHGLSSGSYVCVCLSDTGMGMDAATLARAVEPFFTTKGIGKGTGLGLSMIHGLAVQSGGTLRLKSEAGVGTTAEIWLPQGGAVAAASVGEAITRPAHRTCTVLLVEDDPLVLTSTAAMLDHNVVEASSGEAALRILLASGHAELPDRSGLGVPRLTKPFRQDELESAIAALVTPAREPINVVPFRRS